MARKPKVSKEETSKPGPKKSGRIQKKPRMVHSKKTQKVSKVDARVADSKSVSSHQEKSSYDGRRKPKVKHAPVSTESSIFADFLAKIEMELKQQVVEALQPVIYQCTREIITEELKPVRMMIESMNDNLNEKIGGLENLVSERFRDISTMIQNNRSSFIQEIQEEVGDASEGQPVPFINSNEKFNDTNKKLKKRNSINETDRFKKDSENLTNGIPLPTMPTEQKKKRGRKPKGFYQNNTSIVLESTKDVEDNVDKRQYVNKSKEDASQQDSSQKSDSIRQEDNHSAIDSVDEAKSVQQEENEMEIEIEAPPIAIENNVHKKETEVESEESHKEAESPQLADKINYLRFSNLVAPSNPPKAPVVEQVPIVTKNIQVVEPDRSKPKEVPAVQIQTPVKIYQREPEVRQIGLTSKFQFESSKKTVEKEYAQASSSNEGKYKNDHEFFSFN